MATILTASYLTVDDIVGDKNDKFMIIYRYVVNYSPDPRLPFLSLSAVNSMNWVIPLFSLFQCGKCSYFFFFFFNSPFFSSGLESKRLCCSLPIVSEK